MEFDIPKDQSSIIKVIGVGGGGGNAVNHMYNQGIKGVDFVVCNTDQQALDISPVPVKIQLGSSLTEGRGAGAIPEIGKNAAIENIDDIREILANNTKMVFITAGMGGGTGTGAAPVIAKVAKDMGILTVGIVTIPFTFEGRKRKEQAERGLEEMRKNVDTLLIIANDRLREMFGNLSLGNAFGQADNVLTTAAKGIAEVISVTGMVNVDFNDVSTVMKDSGVAIMGSATARGENRAIEAVKSSLNSPLLNDNDIEGATYVLLYITYGTEEILMDEIGDITDFIQDEAGSNADVIWGHGVDPSLEDGISVTVIATGFNTSPISGLEKEPEKKVVSLDNDEVPTMIAQPIDTPVQSPTQSNNVWKEEEKDQESEEEESENEDDKNKDKEEDTEDDITPLKIEMDGLDDRRMRLTIHASFVADFLVNNEGTELYYLTRFESKFNIWKTDFKEKETKLFSKTGSYGSSMFFDKEEKNIFTRTGSGIAKVDLSSGSCKPISYSAEMRHHPNAERRYMFNHAWRQVREKFYVEDLHGVDWDMYKEAYAKFLPYINNGYDFAEMLSELLGEINASHTGARYGNWDKNGDQTASLGSYYDESYTGNGVKILEIMDKSPLDTKSNKIKDGDIIVAIDGHEIDKNENFFPLLNRKAGKKVLIRFKDGESGDEFEEIIKPISGWSEYNLAYERWIKNCEEKVDELSDGRLGYVHIKGMNSASFRDLFDRALGKLHKKEALIIDTRFNGGGWLHDDLATFLSGKMYMSFEPRGQKNMGGEPIWKWQKPSCVLMSEGNYSDAHLFPYTYKSLGIGKLIGMPVPGTGTAVWWERMIDGQTVFGIPQIGMRSTTEGFLVENHDLEPDIKVNNNYEKYINGEDEQLKAAVDELLK